MTKAKLVSAVRRHLTSCDGGDLDAATVERAAGELSTLPDWVYELHRVERGVDVRVTTEGVIADQLIVQLEKARTLAVQLARFDDAIGGKITTALEQLQADATTIATNRARGRKKKLGPTHIALAVRGALSRAGIRPSNAIGALRKALPVLGLTEAEVETALKKSRPYFTSQRN